MNPSVSREISEVNSSPRCLVSGGFTAAFATHTHTHTQNLHKGYHQLHLDQALIIWGQESVTRNYLTHCTFTNLTSGVLERCEICLLTVNSDPIDRFIIFANLQWESQGGSLEEAGLND